MQCPLCGKIDQCAGLPIVKIDAIGVLLGVIANELVETSNTNEATKSLNFETIISCSEFFRPDKEGNRA